MSDFLSNDSLIVEYNQTAIATTAQSQRQLVAFITNPANDKPIANMSMVEGSNKNVTTTVGYDDIQAGALKPFQTEIPHFKSGTRDFVYNYEVNIVRTNVHQTQLARFGSGQEMINKATKSLYRGWDTKGWLSAYTLNPNSVIYNPNVTGTLTIDLILSEGKKIKREIANNLLVSQTEVKLIINAVIDDFLSTSVSNGSQTNRQLFEAEFGALGVGYEVLTDFENSAYITLSAGDALDVNGTLLADQGFMSGFATANSARHYGIDPQLYKIFDFDKNYEKSHDWVFHNQAIELVDQACQVSIFTNA